MHSTCPRPLGRFLPLLLVSFLSWQPALSWGQTAEDPFKSNVRPTEPLSAAEQLGTFRLPPGFEIQLVASEPEIFKPMNLAFDDRGRLWVTDSLEYPYAAPLDQPGRDSIKILEDTNGDGRADRITTFADGLNIPIGVLPCRDGAIAFSIPHIWRFRDLDGDGRADQREKLFGPMGYERDTHGMNNAFRRGFDRWIYACHGFNNETRVQGTDGHEVQMQSGNTYRMRSDGSRIEQFTWGQVNPFGMTLDPLGNLFTADCHSKPVYQLLRGGYYPSFGKPHDGLGFVPPMMDHLHGSTAIAGVAYYSGENFPAEYRGNLFSGNVMTSRVNRNRLEYHGSTILARELPDLVATSDPWFRPVDVQLGPDGALYIADFYNRIIGHYEVPLDHPGRDRQRGRIWRVVYRGDPENTRPAVIPPAPADLSPEDRIAALNDPNLTRRLLVANYLVDHAEQAELEALRQALETASGPTSHQLAHGMWVLHNRGVLPTRLLVRGVQHDAPLVAVHALKILADTPQWNDELHALALEGLRHDDAFARRAAADALGLHPRSENVPALLESLETVPADDPLLRHGIRIALREHLRRDPILRSVAGGTWSEPRMRELASVCLAVPSAPAASLLLQHLEKHDESPEQVVEYVRHAARYLAVEDAPALARLARRRFAHDVALQQRLLESLLAGVQQRGGKFDDELVDWARQVAAQLLQSAGDSQRDWVNVPRAGQNGPPTASAAVGNPWVLQTRSSEDGRQDVFLCSLPHGEQLTGTLRSREFSIPATLSFYTAGHLGFPNQPLVPRNFIRLREAGSDRLLIEARPPRHDTARKVQWDLSPWEGRRGYLELVDGDDRTAYAWLAVGRFEPEVVPLPSVSPRDEGQQWIAAASLIGTFQLDGFEKRLAPLLTGDQVEPAVCGAVAEALLRVAPDPRLSAVAPLLADGDVSQQLRRRISAAIIQRDEATTRELLVAAMRQAPRQRQQQLAQTLAGDRQTAPTLLELVERGVASPRLLRDPTVAQRLEQLLGPGIAERLAALTRGVPADSDVRAELIRQRRETFRQASVSLEEGQRVFERHCAACHQLGGKGPLIGPQLDGIGNRGPDRLIEDILDPNRNVDVAFLTTTLALDSGRIVSGLVRREEGQQLVLVDNQGREFTVARDSIEQQAKIRLSLMPENLADRLSEAEFYNLLAFLLDQQTPREQPATSNQ